MDALESEILRIIDDAPKKVGGESYTKRGGNGNNSAHMLANIDVPTQLMTTVGTGTDWMLPELQGLGINTDTIFRVESAGPISTIVEDPKITKIFIAPNLKAKMNFEGVKIPEDAFSDVKIVFFTPIADKYAKVLNLVQDKNIITALTIETQKIQQIEQLKQICTAPVDIVFANLNDAAMILGLSTIENNEKSIEKRLTEVDATYKHYSGVRVYTLGKFGAWICIDNNFPLNIPVIPTKVVNRTGAGDTFAAGFIAYLFNNIESKDAFIALSSENELELLKNCALYARAAASLKVASGDAPRKAEIDAHFEQHQKILRKIE